MRPVGVLFVCVENESPTAHRSPGTSTEARFQGFAVSHVYGRLRLSIS
jgi:hypothetical protein